MCGLCRLFRGRNAEGCCSGVAEETTQVCRREEPRMHVHCVSGFGRADNALCGCEHSCDRCDSCANACRCDCE